MTGFLQNLKTTIFGTDDEIWEPNPKAWHYKFYLYWQKTGGSVGYTYRENFCHYFRVVFLWAPKNWLIKANYKNFLRPWWVLVLAILGVVATVSPKLALVVIIEPILGLLAMALFAFAFGGVAWVVEKSGLGEQAAEHSKISKWMFDLVLVVGAGIFAYVKTRYFLYGLAGVGVIIAVIGGFISLVLLFEFAASPKKGTGPFEFIRLIGRFLINNKKRRCPYVKLPGEDPI